MADSGVLVLARRDQRLETVDCPQLSDSCGQSTVSQSDAIRILTGIWSKVTTLAFLWQVLVSQTTLLEL